ncbi:MAG TPA: PQQ-binding-like beta-propeller repeat protein [Bacteroidales bacterium]|nr:PQQ-binding-like beta-propeller repeat protein [Bacteroidales bacterium]
MKNLLLLFALILSGSCTSNKNRIYEWRGEGRTGIYQESNLLKEWPENGPPEIRAIENIGNGFGSPTFTDTHFFITGEIDTIATLFCFNLDGEKQWQTEIGREWTKTLPGSRSTPTIVDNLVYTVTGMGNLFCVDIREGEIIWSKGFTEDAEGIPTMHGYTEAPVIDGDKVFWTPGGKEYNVAGLNRFTGELIWYNKGFSERSGYNQGKLIELPDRNIFVTFSAYHMMGFDAGTGEMLWAHEQDNLTLEERILGMGDTHCNAVLFEDGYIYYAAGDGNGGVKLALSEDGSEITEVWRNKGFDGYMGGIVKIDNYLYGTGTVKPELRAINAATGELTDSLSLGSGTIIAADEMLYYYSQKGTMYLLGYDNGKIHEVSSFRITKGSREHFSHPVINKGILYQRHGDVLVAFDIRRLNKGE